MLVEFVGDLFPASGIVPADPVARAHARVFVEGVASKVFPAHLAVQMKNAPPDALYAALEYVQALLPAGEGFAVGAYSLADIAITPFLARAKLSFTHDVGPWAAGEGPKIWETLTTGKIARLAKYMDDLFARESFKATWDEVRSLSSSIWIWGEMAYLGDAHRNPYRTDTRSASPASRVYVRILLSEHCT